MTKLDERIANQGGKYTPKDKKNAENPCATQGFMKTKPITETDAQMDAAEGNSLKRWWREGKNGLHQAQKSSVILRGPVAGDSINVWCPYCHDYHEHSWDRAENNDLPTFRGAHCGPWSPLHKTGYFVAPIHSFKAASKFGLGSLG
jgi:hypothetical protein